MQAYVFQKNIAFNNLNMVFIIIVTGKYNLDEEAIRNTILITSKLLSLICESTSFYFT